jgi:hypothetical protein
MAIRSPGLPPKQIRVKGNARMGTRDRPTILFANLLEASSGILIYPIKSTSRLLFVWP